MLYDNSEGYYAGKELNHDAELDTKMQEYIVKVYNDGTKRWFQNKQLHRTGGPAVECPNGDRYWYQYDRLHRLDGPAVEWASGTKHWYQNGEPHRVDGPAIEYADGTKLWYQNGKLHRLDGPAIERTDGSKEWWQNDVKLPPPKEDSCDGKVVEIEGVKYRLQKL